MIISNPYNPLDQNGDKVHAHGGQIIKANGLYYWIGEDRRGRNKVSCYSTTDFKKWKFCNTILSLDSKAEHYYCTTDLGLEVDGRIASIGNGCNIERPKVLYNKKTEKYVMWMHWELPDDYKLARCAVAVCDTIDGDYTYLGSFNPIGHMSRDCTLFVDDDEVAYFISSARDNKDLHIYRLSEDYLSIDSLERILWPGQEREAPTLFKHKGLYYLLTSGCTGWKPNQGSYSYTDKLIGLWKERVNFGDETTFFSQPTCVFELNGKLFYLGDRWGGSNNAYYDSTSIILPLEFKNREVRINYSNIVEINL